MASFALSYTPPGKSPVDATPLASRVFGADAADLQLGALDDAFAARPSRVQLLVVLDVALDADRFVEACAAAADGVPLGRVRPGAAAGARVSVAARADGDGSYDANIRPPCRRSSPRPSRTCARGRRRRGCSTRAASR